MRNKNPKSNLYTVSKYDFNKKENVSLPSLFNRNTSMLLKEKALLFAD